MASNGGLSFRPRRDFCLSAARCLWPLRRILRHFSTLVKYDFICEYETAREPKRLIPRTNEMQNQRFFLHDPADDGGSWKCRKYLSYANGTALRIAGG